MTAIESTDLQSFVKEFFRGVSIETLIHGNFDTKVYPSPPARNLAFHTDYLHVSRRVPSNFKPISNKLYIWKPRPLGRGTINKSECCRQVRQPACSEKLMCHILNI